MVVYIIDINGNPLMPTSRNRKVRKMLEQGLCHIVKTTPFTIQLDYETTDFKQSITRSDTAYISDLTAHGGIERRLIGNDRTFRSCR